MAARGVVTAPQRVGVRRGSVTSGFNGTWNGSSPLPVVTPG